MGDAGAEPALEASPAAADAGGDHDPMELDDSPEAQGSEADEPVAEATAKAEGAAGSKAGAQASVPVEERHGGQVVPMREGMPEGWEGIRKIVTSGRRAGHAYIRYWSLDGKFRGVASEKEVIRIDARLKGLDVDAAVNAWESRRRAAQREAAAAKASRASGEGSQKLHSRRRRQEHYIMTEEFRRVYGALTLEFIAKLPGWKVSKCIQSDLSVRRTVYTSPEGRTYASIPEVEEHFARKVLQGGTLDDIGLMPKEGMRWEVQLPNRRYLRKRPAASAAGGEPSSSGAARQDQPPPQAQLARRGRWSRFLAPLRGSRGGRPPDAAPAEPAEPQFAPFAGRRLHLLPEAPLDPNVVQNEEDERWVRNHPLWIKMTKLGYPLPISEREILALRSYTPREYGGTADVKYH